MLERVLARSVLVTLRDGEALISEESSGIFDRASWLVDERKRSIMQTVCSGSYDKTKDYFLICHGVKTNVDVVRIALKVDQAFANGFYGCAMNETLPEQPVIIEEGADTLLNRNLPAR